MSEQEEMEFDLETGRGDTDDEGENEISIVTRELIEKTTQNLENPDFLPISNETNVGERQSNFRQVYDLKLLAAQAISQNETCPEEFVRKQICAKEEDKEKIIAEIIHPDDRPPTVFRISDVPPLVLENLFEDVARNNLCSLTDFAQQEQPGAEFDVDSRVISPAEVQLSNEHEPTTMDDDITNDCYVESPPIENAPAETNAPEELITDDVCSVIMTLKTEEMEENQLKSEISATPPGLVVDEPPEHSGLITDVNGKNVAETTNMNATNALKNLHELITNVTGVEEPSSVVASHPIAASKSPTPLFLPLVTPATSSSCPNVTVIGPNLLSEHQRSSSSSSMENIGSKLLLLAAAQSSKSLSTSFAAVDQTQITPPQLSVRPKDNSQSTTIKTKRLLLPKPVAESTTNVENSSSIATKTSTTVTISHRPENAKFSAVSSSKSSYTTPPKNVVAPSAQAQRIGKMLNRASVAPYTFEPPPANANLQIPNGGYRCAECGDCYAMKTCLEFHLQRRSVMIETICIPCKQMFMFFNKCVYFAHIRMHRSKKWMTNVFRSVTVKPVTWKLMELWFDDTAFRRFSNPDAFFDYEFGNCNNNNNVNSNSNSKEIRRKPPNDHTTIEWRNDVQKSTTQVRCSECSTELADSLALKRHFMYNLPVNQKQFICTSCQAVYFSQCSFQAHKRTHNTSAPFVCPECGETLQNSSSLSSHLLTHRTKPTVLDSWRCVKCFTFYSSWEALVIHMAAAHCEMHHCCRSCTMAFSSAVAFEEHKQTAHKYAAQPETIEYRLLAKCCSCESLGFQGKDALIEHLKQHFGSVSPFKVYRCAMCGRLMENKGGLVSHFKNVHRINVAPTNIEEDRIVIPSTSSDPPPISLTPTTTTTTVVVSSSAATTVPTTTAAAGVPLKYYSCKICRNLHFRSELGLKLHVKMKHSSDTKTTVVGPPPVGATAVPLKFVQPEQLLPPRPMTGGTSAAPPAPIPLLSCYLCKKSFDDLDCRMKDGLQHLKNGQVVCLLCQNLPMSSAAMLIRHFSKHIDEQERSGKLRDGVIFVCNRHCKEEFVDRAKALNHLRTIHGQLPLICDVCRADFVNEIDLRQHKTSAHAAVVDDPLTKIIYEHAGLKRAASEVTKVAASLAKKSCIVQPSSSTAPIYSPPTTTTYGSYKCMKCLAKFDVREKMHQHAIEQHKEAKFYTCLECATNFASPPSLGRHLITAHQISDVERYLKEFSFSHPQKTNDFECDVCHQVFPSKISLDSHVRTHGLLFLKTQEKRVD